MTTPEEMASSSDGPKTHDWLLDERRQPREILRFIKASPSPEHNHTVHLATQTLNVRISEIADVSTRRIVRLTWALLIFTAALLIFTIFLYKDTHADIQQRTLTEHHEAQHP